MAGSKEPDACRADAGFRTARILFPAGYLSCAKRKNPEFFWPEIFMPVRAIRIFVRKPGTAGKLTTDTENANTVYTRIPGNYPVSGYLIDNLFSRQKFFCRNFSGMEPLAPHSRYDFHERSSDRTLTPEYEQVFLEDLVPFLHVQIRIIYRRDRNRPSKK